MVNYRSNFNLTISRVKIPWQITAVLGVAL
jgi:hypothetical protein